jgi:gliding motility-associated-like protein
MKRLLCFAFTLFTGLSIACDTDVTIAQGSSISFCAGSNTVVSAASGFVSYSWTGPQNFSTATIFPSVSGQYVVEAIDAIGCISTDTIDVTVFSAPFGVIVSSEGNVICPGGPGTVLSLTQGFTSYLWSTGSTVPILPVDEPGTYSVQVTDANGCSSNTSIIISSPNFALNVANSTICSGMSTSLSASGGSSYLWSGGETSPSITVSPEISTEYTVEITSGNCSTTLSATIEVVDVGNSFIQDTFIIAEGDVIFMNGPEGYDSYSWSPTENLTLTDTQGSTFIGTESSTYVLTSIHNAGCVRVDTFTVIVLQMTAPTGFSPNNDQQNDLFVVPELNVYKGKIMIWNRWGDLVFESEHYQNNWDGTCESSMCMGNGPLPEGTYYYQIEAENLTFTGFTTIKR